MNVSNVTTAITVIKPEFFLEGALKKSSTKQNAQLEIKLNLMYYFN